MGLIETDMWQHMAEGPLPAYDQPQLSEAAVDQPAATPADNLAQAGVKARAEYEADPKADDAAICPPTRTLLALLEVREVWKARRSGDSNLCEGRPPPRITECSHVQAVFPMRASCTGPLANLELPTVEQLAKAIPATINQRINTTPELQHAQWLTDTMMADGVEMQQNHTETKLLRRGDDNLCAISLGKEDEEFADTLRRAVALTSPVALLRAVRLRTIVIYLTESEFDPSELLIHPFSQTIREGGDHGGNTGHN
eukprot:jgi/Tetstr1/442621/TSEL_030717.t1